MSTLSVVIPCRNDAGMLAVCLRALAAQTRLPDEIVVVDNASTDNTRQVCAEAGVRWHYERLPGIPAATASGFDAARGQLLTRLDADSVPPPDWLERMHTLLSDNGTETVITGPGDFYGGNPVLCWIARTLYIGGYRWSMELLLGHPPVFGSNFGLSRELWERLRTRVNRDLPQVHDDLDLCYHLEPDTRVLWVPDLVVGVSVRPLQSWRGLGRRLHMAYLTFRIDFRQEPPLARLRRRREWLREHPRPASPPG